MGNLTYGMDAEIAKRLVMPKTNCRIQNVLIDFLLRLYDFTCEEQLADMGEILLCFRVEPVARPAGPERFLVELETFTINSSKSHCAERTVPERQCLRPDMRISRPAKAEFCTGFYFHSGAPPSQLAAYWFRIYYTIFLITGSNAFFSLFH